MYDCIKFGRYQCPRLPTFAGSMTATQISRLNCTLLTLPYPGNQLDHPVNSHRNVQTTSSPHCSHKPQYQRNQDPSLSIPRWRTARTPARQCRLLRRERCTQRPHPIPDDESPCLAIKRISTNLDMDWHWIFRSYATRMVEACGLEFTGAV